MANPLQVPHSSLLPSPAISLLSSIESSPGPQPAVQTRREGQCYVVLPTFSSSVKSLYQPLPDYLGGDPEFVRDDLDAVVGEFPFDSQCKPSHYFVRFKDGLARRISSRTLLAHYSDLVNEYQRRKGQGLLDHFNPASGDVHEYSRMRGRKPSRTVGRIATSQIESVVSHSSGFLTGEDDISDNEDGYISRSSTRISPRLAGNSGKLIQSKLPFSPRKLRSNRTRRRQLASDSEDDLGGYGQVDSDVEILPTRRSTRSQRTARSDSADDTYYVSPRHDSEEQVKKRLKKRSPTAARPAYGHFRDIDDLDFDSNEDEVASSLRAHRDICEKCHKRPAHMLLMKAKKGGRRAKKFQGESDESDGSDVRGMGGWVRCLKCPVAAHWRCLAKSQRNEITRAARVRDEVHWKAQVEKANEEPSTYDLPDRKELDVTQTTEFVCGLCTKGGICMGCLEVALEPDPSFIKKRLPPLESAQSGVPDTEAGDNTSPVETTTLHPSEELFFRCFSCKRLAHYRHLPTPENAAWEDEDLANYYQEETAWRCADCASYVYPLDKILAWRPFPSGVVEPDSAHPPDAKAFLPREYLVKWADRSYRRTQWVPHMWLVSTNLSKLRHFLNNGPKVALLDEAASDEMAMDVDGVNGVNEQPIDFEPSADVAPETGYSAEQKDISLGPLPDAERRIPPAWKTIDRILDVRFWMPSSGATANRKGKGVTRRDPVNRSLPDSLLQLERAYTDGEQPDESLMGELDDWLSIAGESLSIEDIDKVIWVFVKWEDLGYEEATWDSPPRHGEAGYGAYERAFQYFIDSREVRGKNTKKEIALLEARAENGYDRFALKRDLDEQPDLGQSNQLKLMKFQIDGYNWLCDNWWNRQPSILADEMGLGKTVQIVTFLGTLVEKFNATPALVVVPNSTITNWVREFSRWAPRLRVIPFFGEAKSRDVVMRYELFRGTKREPRYHVLITTYETITNPRDFTTVFKSVGRWEVLVVDEGQRLKSDNSLLFKKLNELRLIHRIIMTGTPLNNNIRELFNLMNFLDADKWQDLEALEKEYEELSEDLVRQLHVRLKPYFLRRVKSEVLQLPPKKEVIVPLSMTPLQKEIYRSILSQNLDVLKQLTQVSSFNAGRAGRAGISKTNMNNVLMQLRKCIQHPYLISDDIEPRGLEPHEAHEKLIDASTKLRLLKSLLPKLKVRGHRVLLFSQFVIALDIIEDFLKGENHKYLRLDGETKQVVRQKGMDEFNKPDSEYFIYLLSTRAGGVGINLYTADTVIIYDPDFNPHQDLQAIARSHRYGQQKTCLVFKFMVKNSAEERILQASKKKLVLDHLIVQKMDNDENGGDDLTSILTFGAKALFEEGDQGPKDIVYTDHDLDKLIERTEIEGDREEAPREPGLKFNFAKVWAAEKDILEDIGDAVLDTDSWAQALERIAAEKAATKEKEVTGRGVRRKAAAAFPQQQLDFLDNLEETPAKGRGKGKGKKKDLPVKSGTPSDYDVYDDTDTTTESMDVDQEPLLAVELPRKQRSYLTAPFPTVQSQPRFPHHSYQECGLCGQSHASGACSMLESSSNLMEYRHILLNHTTDEPWEYRKAAIDAIEQALCNRGQGHLLAGQPLKLVSQPGPASTSVKVNRSTNRDEAWVDRHNSSLSKATALEATEGPPPQLAVAHRDRGSITNGHTTVPSDLSVPGSGIPYKRLSSPDGILENLPKKQKQNGYSGCPVCLGPYHPIENCPIAHQDTQSITRHILRLSDDPSQVQVVNYLQRIVKQRGREVGEAGPW